MGDRRGAGRERREPRFGPAPGDSSLDLRLRRDDRAASPSMNGSSRRRKPEPRRPKPRRRGFLFRLVYGATVLGLWGFIALAGLVAYHATQLPPIDQLAVPKRPPNIAIMAADGSLLANRGETGGRTVSVKELPPYLPRAFVAIEDRRFYSHFGVDPIGIMRAQVRNVTARGVSQGGSTLTQQSPRTSS